MVHKGPCRVTPLDTLSDSSNVALERLRALLEEGAFSQNQRVPPERSLAAQIGIGRRALRRALEVLEAEGRIWRHQGKGTFLGPRPTEPHINLEELSKRTHPLEVMHARLEIEPSLARLAALRALVINSRKAVCPSECTVLVSLRPRVTIARGA